VFYRGTMHGDRTLTTRTGARDGRVARVRLTAKGDRILLQLTPSHLVELHSLAAVLDDLVAAAGRTS
jgi:DNA-binding MarR family transcriptional regulator